MKRPNWHIYRRQNLDDIHQYVEDLESVIHLRERLLRSHEPNKAEIDSFDRTIHVMQLVLEHLNERL